MHDFLSSTYLSYTVLYVLYNATKRAILAIVQAAIHVKLM